MRRTAVLALVLVAGAAVPAASPARDAHNAQARLRLVALRPLEVTGRGFQPVERVTVVAFAREQRLSRRVTATRDGRFAVAFRSLNIDRCTSVAVRARGSRGSRASVSLRSVTECPELVP